MKPAPLWLNAALSICLVLLAVLGPVRSAAAANVGPNSYAWGENIGWLNALPQGASGPGLQVSDAGVSGFMWGENVGWLSFSCVNTSSCASVNYGVTRDASGALSGYAWGENVGWVSLSCRNTGTCATANYGVAVDPASGIFSGFAWSENVGWISFSCANTASCGTVPFGIQEMNFRPVPALAPAALALLCVALAGLAMFRRRCP